MTERKNPGRFTVQFNMNDPQQRAAAELLERQGRRKAQYIASAVRQYAQSGSGATTRPDIDEAMLERMIRRILAEGGNTETTSREANIPRKDGEGPEPWDTERDTDSFSAISSTLAAFRHG